jgi:hypothetical protein
MLSGDEGSMSKGERIILIRSPLPSVMPESATLSLPIKQGVDENFAHRAATRYYRSIGHWPNLLRYSSAEDTAVGHTEKTGQLSPVFSATAPIILY